VEEGDDKTIYSLFRCDRFATPATLRHPASLRSSHYFRVLAFAGVRLTLLCLRTSPDFLSGRLTVARTRAALVMYCSDSPSPV
jgi:hypothetical protein